MTETERTKPRALAAEEAIQLALESRWVEAVAINRRILEQHGPDEDSNNRLGKALSEIGEIPEAIDAYRRTLELNPLNIIAPKMLRKLQALLEQPSALEGSNTAIDVDLFTEEPGKSGLSQLSASPDVPAGAVSAGDVVEISVEDGGLHARTARGIDLGFVEAKLARRLVPLIETGNRYEAAVLRLEGARVEVMIRETSQSPENSRKTSFPIARGARREEFRPYGKESMLASRGSDDDEALESDDESIGLVTPDDDDVDGLGGLQTTDTDLDAGAEFVDDDDDDDDDSRPEDSY